MEQERDGHNNCNWCARSNYQKIGIEIGRFGNKRTRGDHPENNVIKIS